MAEQRLMPALRTVPEARQLAKGFSCRRQIRNHGDNHARHLAELLRDTPQRQPA